MTTTELTIEREVITPELAAEYLAKNRSNRPMRKSVMNRLVGALLRGEWRDNGETIKFFKDGTLADGQHRLTAAVVANKSISVLVVRGLNPSDIETVDLGIKRSIGDMLKHRGFSYAPEVGALSRKLLVYEDRGQFYSGGGGHSSAAAYTPQQVIAYARKHQQELEECCAWAKRWYTRNRHLGMPRSEIGALAIVFERQTDEGVSELFFAELEEVGPKGSGVLSLLVARLVKEALAKQQMTPRHRGALVIKAWNCWVQNEPTGMLRWSVGESFPAVMGDR